MSSRDTKYDYSFIAEEEDFGKIITTNSSVCGWSITTLDFKNGNFYVWVHETDKNPLVGNQCGIWDNLDFLDQKIYEIFRANWGHSNLTQGELGEIRHNGLLGRL